jgi:hypothetical protein
MDAQETARKSNRPRNGRAESLIGSRGIYFFLIVQVLASLILSIAPGPHDFYPFYDWRMFSDVNPTEVFYRVELECADNHCPRQDVYDHQETFFRSVERKNFFNIQSLGQLFVRDAAAFADYENQFVGDLVTPGDKLTYALHEIVIDGVEYAKSRTTKSDKVLVRRACDRSNPKGIQCSSLPN